MNRRSFLALLGITPFAAKPLLETITQAAYVPRPAPALTRPYRSLLATTMEQYEDLIQDQVHRSIPLVAWLDRRAGVV